MLINFPKITNNFLLEIYYSDKSFLIVSCVKFMLNFGNILYDYVQIHDNLKTNKLKKYEKLKIKIRKTQLNLTFLTNYQALYV